MNGRAIGMATTRLDTVAGGFRLDDNLVLDVPALDTVARAVAVTRIALDDSLTLTAFTFRLESAVGRFGARGERTSAGTLDVVLEAAAGSTPSRLSLRDDLLLDAAVPLRMAAAGALVPGRTFEVDVFDPSTMSTRAVRLSVTARDTLILPDSVDVDDGGRFIATGWDTIPVWRVEQSLGGIDVATWVDEDGLPVRAETPLGFTIESTAIASNAVLTDLAERDSLRVRLLDVDPAGFDLAGGRQTLRGDTLTVRREAWPVPASYALPWRQGGAPAMELESTPLIQSEDPRIVRAAREAVGETTDPMLAAERLNAFVYGRLRKAITPSIPSAVQVLEALQGDCNEHTVLYVALARSIGLPARTAAGLVHIGGRFYYHAWPEVWSGLEWVAMDPTLGQVPADASHLRFITGGLARQIELIRLIGRLRLEVL
jgi:transglutaminase-like putative cysteine protease